MDRELEVEQLVARSGTPKDLGVEFRRLLPDRVVATMPVDDRHLQPLGVLHGGVSLTLAESVAAVGAWLNCPAGKVAFGSTINADHLRLKHPGGRLTAAATPDHIDHEKQIWKVEIRGENGRRVCVSRCTLSVVDLGSAFAGSGEHSA